MSASLKGVRRVAICVLLAACLIEGQAAELAEVISPGSDPISQTWTQMVQQDQTPAKAKMSEPTVQTEPLRIPVSDRKPGTMPFLPAAPQGSGFLGFLPLAPQTLGTNFATINLQDQFNAFGSGSIPPDTMGAVGPNHFFMLINGSAAVFSKTGTLLSHVSLNSFFTFTVVSTTYPQNGAFDPRILFDRRSSRWFACALERGVSSKNNHILLTVSRTSDPLTAIWDKYLIPVGEADQGSVTYFTDFDTMGTDDNGVYFGMRIFLSSGSSYAKIAATAKPSLLALSPTLSAVTQWSNITDMYSSPQPAHNQDSTGPSDPAWFAASSTSVYGNINYRSLIWSGGSPNLSSTAVLTSPGYAGPFNAPASGSSVDINVGDDRLHETIIRNGRLWTCRNIGVGVSGTAADADRTGCEWLVLDVSSPTPTLLQNGRVYDTAASNPRYYYYPSLMVSGQGNALLAFSGSKSSEFVGAYTCGRLAGDPAGTMGDIALIKSGEAAYQRLDGSLRNRWGDYSYTSLDPNDDMSIWTVQEYATGISSNIWGTWTTKWLATTPTLTSPIAHAAAGVPDVTLLLTGTNFYDPGPSFTNRLSATLAGGIVNGISNYRITYTSPTAATVTFDIATGATPGLRNVILMNPDGQTATAVGGFTVDPLAGDADLDGTVTGTDLAIVLASYDLSTGNAGFDPRADLNLSGTVNAADLAVLLDHLDQTL